MTLFHISSFQLEEGEDEEDDDDKEMNELEDKENAEDSIKEENGSLDGDNADDLKIQDAEKTPMEKENPRSKKKRQKAESRQSAQGIKLDFGDEKSEKPEKTDFVEDEFKSKSKGKEKEESKSILHPFFERTRLKLGNIKKKMARLKQNLKDIQIRKSKRTGNDDNEVEVKQEVDNIMPDDEILKKRITKNLQYMQLPDVTDLEVGVGISRKRYMDVNETPSSSSKSRKRRSNDSDSIDVEESASNTSVIKISSGRMIVSDINDKSVSSSNSLKGKYRNHVLSPYYCIIFYFKERLFSLAILKNYKLDDQNECRSKTKIDYPVISVYLTLNSPFYSYHYVILIAKG